VPTNSTGHNRITAQHTKSVPENFEEEKKTYLKISDRYNRTKIELWMVLLLTCFLPYRSLKFPQNVELSIIPRNTI
jgi:hypothetical protein